MADIESFVFVYLDGVAVPAGLLAPQRCRGEELPREGRRHFGPVANLMGFRAGLSFAGIPTTAAAAGS